ncbi:MAG: PCRF domain-containing protein, partial [Brevinema sp.]
MHPKAGDRLNTIKELDQKLATLNPSDREFGKLAKERATYDEFLSKHDEYEKTEQSITEYEEWLSSSDQELKSLAKEELPLLKETLDQLYQEVLVLLIPQDPMKNKDALVEIRGGAGGDEAALFAGDLFRMYSRYAESRRWKIEVLSSNEAGVGGYKEIIFTVSGKDVYGTLKLESGVHRVQRVP